MTDQTGSSQTQPVRSAAPKASRRPTRDRRRILFLIGGAIILISAGALLRAHLRNQHSSHGTHRLADKARNDGDTVPVAITVVKTGDMPEIFTELGTVVPITTVSVQARVSGYITNVAFKEGQRVKAGDELVLIDPRPYQVALEQTLGTLNQDQAQLADAQINAGRYEKLIKQNSIATMTAIDAQYKVKQLEGTVKLDQANVDNARLNLYYCHILAPVDGRVGLRAVDKGNYFSAGQAGGLTVLTQMQPISIIFTVPQDQLPQVKDRLRKVGSLPVEAWDSGNLNKIATGSVEAVDSQLDTATGTVRMRAIFSNEDEHLFPNQFVNAHLLVETLRGVTLISSNALQTGPEGPFVFVVKDDNTVELRNVTTGISGNDLTVVKSGLKLGERVVTDGTNHLRPGTKVNIPEDASAPKVGTSDLSTVPSANLAQ